MVCYDTGATDDPRLSEGRLFFRYLMGALMSLAKKGFIFSILSAFFLSAMNLFVKLLGAAGGTPLPSSEIAFFRGLIGTIAVLAYMLYKGIHFSKEDRKLLVMRGLYGGFGMICNFIAIVHLKMSDAAILFQLSGIFVLIFAGIFLKERIPKGAGKWLLIIFAAVMVMVNPFQYSSFNWYALVAILGAALSAAAYTTIRSIANHGKHSSFEIMAYFMVTGMIAGAVTTPSVVIPQGIQWAYILAIGGISVLSQFFLTGAFIATNAVIAQFLQYIGVFFNAMWGFLAFGESIAAATICAGLAMFVSSVMLAKLKEENPAVK